MGLPRRTFLKGVGLGTGAAFLSPVMQHAMTMQCFDAPELPRRFVFVIQGNGIRPDYLTTPGAEDLVDTVEQTRMLQELSPSPTNILSALSGTGGELDLTPYATALLNVSSKIAGGGHTCYYRALSCSSEPRETFDAWLARKLYVNAPFDAIRLGVIPSTTTPFQYDNMFLNEYGVSQPIYANPKEAFNGLFGSIGKGDVARNFRTEQHLLDFAKRDVSAALSTFSGNSRERAKLETYLGAIEQLSQEKTRLFDKRDCLENLVAYTGVAPTSSAFEHKCPLVRMEAQYELATAALLGQMTNVAVLTNSVGNAFAYTRYHSLKYIMQEDPDFDGGVPWLHGLAHMAGGIADSETSVAGQVAREVLRRSRELQVEQIAKLARTLASVPEGDGTMLDHTVIVFMSDNGGSHHSQCDNWPILLMGGGALGLKTGGRTLISPKFGTAGNLRVSNVLNTLGHVAGFDLNDWGGEPDRKTVGGPIPELLA